MTNNTSILISNTSLSAAWLQALEFSISASGHHLENLCVSVDIGPDGFKERVQTRVILNRFLTAHNMPKVETVANTIFPSSLWNRNAPRNQLYKRYRDAYPRVKKCPANRRGTYFHRMIDYGEGTNTTNQLEHIIENWRRGNHRHSAFQIGIFNPSIDHLGTRILGFPCLHQVCFNPRGANGSRGLGMTAFYATQHLLNKAYGNYLGLIRLGEFVAHETGLTLTNFTCVIGSADLQNSGAASMSDIRDLVDAITSSET